MENNTPAADELERLLAQRLKALRQERGWSLDELAKRSLVSRATLSRLENAEVSPTTSVLGKLCSAYGLPMSRLMRMIEDTFQPLVPRAAQAVWADPVHGFRRRSVSPPAATLAGEALECELQADTTIHYDTTPRPGLEHHLIMLTGQLGLCVDGQQYQLRAGDCLRYQLQGASTFQTPPDSGAIYILLIV